MLFVTKTKATIHRVYSLNEHSVWHGILDVKNDFVSENMLALSTLVFYHSIKGNDYAWSENDAYHWSHMSYIACILFESINLKIRRKFYSDVRKCTAMSENVLRRCEKMYQSQRRDATPCFSIIFDADHFWT